MIAIQVRREEPLPSLHGEHDAAEGVEAFGGGPRAGLAGARPRQALPAAAAARTPNGRRRRMPRVAPAGPEDCGGLLPAAPSDGDPVRQRLHHHRPRQPEPGARHRGQQVGERGAQDRAGVHQEGHRTQAEEDIGAAEGKKSFGRVTLYNALAAAAALACHRCQ